MIGIKQAPSLLPPLPDKKYYECKILPICARGCPYEKILFNEVQCDRRLFSLQEILKLTYGI